VNRRVFLSCVGSGVAPLVTPSMCHADDAPVYRADDVKVIATWLLGRETGKAFKEPFTDSDVLIGTKDIFCYTDVPDVKWPKDLRSVPYDFVQARFFAARHSRKGTLKELLSGIVITGSIAADPPDTFHKDKFDPIAAGDRCYYVDVRIGPWEHWIKFVVSGAGESFRAKVVSHRTG
jgi:hypothetical protein